MDSCPRCTGFLMKEIGCDADTEARVVLRYCVNCGGRFDDGIFQNQTLSREDQKCSCLGMVTRAATFYPQQMQGRATNRQTVGH